MRYLTNYFRRELGGHAFDYLLLVTAGIFFLVAVNSFKGERLLEFIILLSFASFYIIWGVYHHLIEDSLHLKIVIEYILIGFTILFLLKVIVFP